MTVALSDNLLDTALSELRTGKMLQTVAAELGCSRQALSKALRKRRNFTLPHVYRQANNATKFDRNEMVRLYMSGESVLALSKRFGCQRKTITDHLDRIGINRRDSSSANTIRMSRLSKTERFQLTHNAHKAILNRPVPVQRKIKIANVRQVRETHKGFLEDELANLLRLLCFNVVQQHQFGFYNFDLFINDRIAVEVSTHSFSRHMRDRPEKIEQIIKSRIPLFYIHITSEKAGRMCLNNIITDLYGMNGLPSGICQHRMVRCGIKRYARSRNDTGRFDSVKIPEEPLYTMVREETIRP